MVLRKKMRAYVADMLLLFMVVFPGMGFGESWSQMNQLQIESEAWWQIALHSPVQLVEWFF